MKALHIKDLAVYLQAARILGAVLLLSVSQSAFADPDWILHEGTPIRMRITRTISSADAHEGDRVDFQTLDDVSVGNVVVIPKNSTCLGTVTVAESKKRMARGGKLGLNIDFVRLPSGEKLALRGVQNLKGGGHTGAMTGGIVAAAIVLWPAAPFFLFMHGKDVSIPEGHEVTVYTNSELKLDTSKIATASAPAVTAGAAARTSGPALTNPDILKLKSLGLSDELIVQKINASPGNYKLEVDDLGRLIQSGLSNAVIGAMMRARPQ